MFDAARDIRDYTITDVFTDAAFGGNPLAIVHDGQGLTAGQMQRMAREFNLSETVFLLPPTDATNDHRLRIFTPAVELPFAGHPTVGAALFLADRATPPVGRLRLEEQVGVVTVDIAHPDEAATATLTAAVRPTFDGRIGAAEVAAIVGLPTASLVDDAEVASAGVAFLFAELSSLDELGAAQFDHSVWAEGGNAPVFGHVFLYCGHTTPGSTFRGRMFAPSMGIEEDPATGAAATALAALLASRWGVDGSHHWTLEQGVEMGRPSTLQLHADLTNGEVTSARVGGNAVVVAAGSMAAPPP